MLYNIALEKQNYIFHFNFAIISANKGKKAPNLSAFFTFVYNYRLFYKIRRTYRLVVVNTIDSLSKKFGY